MLVVAESDKIGKVETGITTTRIRELNQKNTSRLAYVLLRSSVDVDIPVRT